MASENWPTYILLSLYVLAMIIVTIIANVKNRKNNKMKSIQATTYSNPDLDVNNVVTTHFLAAKNFGPFLLLLTTFASIFSGYTIVGVPDEAGKYGFIAIRWVAAVLSIGASLLMIFPRIRRLSMKRNYQSPGDFINDRFNSKPLCGLIALYLCIPQLLYLSVQIYSLGAVLSNLTNGELSFYSVSIVSALLILIFEIFGGMRSVAYTDAVQATVMILVFVAIPIIIGIQYGGFIGQVVNSDDVPCDNSNDDETSGCLNYADGGIADEYYLRTPSSITTINFILFTLSALSFSINPHVLQRAFAAQHDWQVRFVTKCMFVTPFGCMIPGLLTGITYISNKPELKDEYQTFSAFQAMLAIFRDEGGFIQFVSYIALLAGIAGIMSTADSSLIGVSNTLSCDIFQNWLTPNVSPKRIVFIGEIISLCTMLLSIGFAIYIYHSKMEFGVLAILQSGILWQAFPAYIFGLYTNIGTKSILFGILFGLVCNIIFVGMVFSGNDPMVSAHPALSRLDKSWSSLIGVLLNLFVCFIGHFCCRWKDNYHENDNDDHLSIYKIRQIMKGTKEPMTRFYGLFVWLILICLLVSAFHWIGDIDPVLIEEYGKEEVKSFTYNGYIVNVIAGFPLWSFASLMWFVIAAICGLIASSLWNVEDESVDTLTSNSKSATSEETTHLSQTQLTQNRVQYVDEDIDGIQI